MALGRHKMDPDIPLWHRQPRETRLMFERFEHYTHQDGRRSIRRVAEHASVQIRELQKVATKWSWTRRAEAYDIHKQHEVDNIRVNAIADMEARQADAGVAMQALALQEMKKILARSKKNKKSELTATELTKMLEVGAKLERQARGEPGDIVKTKAEQTISVTKSADRAISKLAAVLGVSLEELDDDEPEDQANDSEAAIH